MNLTKEKKKVSSKRYFDKHKDKITAKNKEYYYKNWESKRAYCIKYKIDHPDKVKEQRKKRAVELRGGYVADYASKKRGVPASAIKHDPLTLELERNLIKLKRTIIQHDKK